MLTPAKAPGAARPAWLPMPRCRVMLVCGPPAAGKSTYIRDHAGRRDIVIDLDEIAEEFGLGRDRLPETAGMLYAERNKRLANLKWKSRSAVAWVVIKDASLSVREWWIKRLGVQPADVIVLTAPREELRRRILADKTRRWSTDRDFTLVDEWIEREQHNDPGRIRSGCSADGLPLDELHPWAGRS